MSTLTGWRSVTPSSCETVFNSSFVSSCIGVVILCAVWVRCRSCLLARTAAAFWSCPRSWPDSQTRSRWWTACSFGCLLAVESQLALFQRGQLAQLVHCPGLHDPKCLAASVGVGEHL